MRKERGQRLWKGENDGGFSRKLRREQGEKGGVEAGKRERDSEPKKRARERIYDLALGHHIAQVPVSNFPLEMTASISTELFA